MDCPTLKKIKENWNDIIDGMSKHQKTIVNGMLQHMCEDHDMHCECGEEFSEVK